MQGQRPWLLLQASRALWWCVALWLGSALCLTGAARAQDLQPVPMLQAHVNDLSRTLGANDAAQLEQQLADFERQHGTQIAVLLVNTTAPEDIADYTQRVAEAWKLGRARVGDGLLLVVAVQDRRVRIAPYKALEGAIPDVLARRIIDQQIVPAFRQGDYAGGLRSALTQLQAHITGEALPAPAPRPQVDEFDIVEAAILLLVAVPMVSALVRQILGRRLGAFAGAGAAGFLVWQISGRVWMALLAGLIGFFGGLLSRGLPVSAPQGGWGRHTGHGSGHWGGGDGWGGGGLGGGMSSGGGGDAGGGGASGSW